MLNLIKYGINFRSSNFEEPIKKYSLACMLIFCLNNIIHSQCQDMLENPNLTITTNSGDDLVAYPGITEITYCFTLIVPEDAPPIQDASVLFIASTLNFEPMLIPVELGEFEPFNTGNSYIAFYDVEPGAVYEYCLTFLIDPTFDFDMNDYIYAHVITKYPGCHAESVAQFVRFYPTLLNDCALSEDFENRGNQNASTCSGNITHGTVNGVTLGVTQGSPRVVSPGCGGGKGLLIGVNGNQCSEGFYLENDFNPGVTYTVSFDAFISAMATGVDLNDYILNILAASGLNSVTNNVNSNCPGYGSGSNTTYCSGTPPTGIAQQAIQTVSYIDYQNTSPNGSNCVNTTITFTPTIAFSQLWIYPGNIGCTELNVGLVIDNICVSGTDPCCEVTPTFTYVPLDELVCLVFQFSNTAKLCEGATFLWEFMHSGDVIGSSTEENPIFEFPDYDIDYSVRLTIIVGECAYVTTVPFPVLPCAEVKIENGNYEFNQVGINETKIIQKIFPNPANEDVTIELQSPFDEKGMITLLDIAGHIISSSAIELHKEKTIKIKLPISHLQNGIYTIKYEGKFNASVDRFVVERE